MKKIKTLLNTALICIGIFYFSLYILPIFLPSIGTKYSERFDMDIFESIPIGEERIVVDSLLGKPIYESIDNVNRDSIKTNYWYSKSTSGLLMYEKIIIQFYEDKVVNKIRALDGD